MYQRNVCCTKGAVAMNYIHFITLSRIVIAPIFAFLYFNYPDTTLELPELTLLLLGIFLVAGLTDFFDGFLARCYKRESQLGKILDPMADTVFKMTLFITFSYRWISLPIALIFIMLYREFIISTLRILCALKGIALGARFSGKLKTFSQFVSLTIILISFHLYSIKYLTLDSLRSISLYAVSITTSISMFSGTEYLYKNRHLIKNHFFI